MITTCRLLGPNLQVTIGWANIARTRDFHAYIATQMARGTRYYRVNLPPGREVIYNAATMINHGVPASTLAFVRERVPGFLDSGDISIVHVAPSATQEWGVQLATPQDVFATDSIEVLP